jgi:hypothetical protein
MSSTKRAVVDATCPLQDAGILLHMMNILGPGQHLFISAVSNAWGDSYKRVSSVQMAGFTEYYNDKAVMQTITSPTTLYSAVFASGASVRLVHECGLAFDYQQLQRTAGTVADVSTMRAACGLGLQLTDDVLIGAAVAASVPKLQWLHKDQLCPLPPSICNYAARSGSVDVLTWLKEHGCAFTADTCNGAAAGEHIHVLKFLRDEECEWNELTCATAARHGHLPTLQWLHQQGCPWERDEIFGDAAEVGDIEMLVYLKQQGCAFNKVTMTDAAWKGQLAVCQFLLAEQCPCDAEACAEAAAGGYLETVRLLHESGCPWEADSICERTAQSGNVELLRYLNEQGCVFTAAVMSTAALWGHTQACKYLHDEQCAWDATACRNAMRAGHVDTLRYLHEQGCPWDLQAARAAAAKQGHVATITYALSAAPAASAAQLTELLNAAGSRNRLAAAQWLRQQGAEWPAVLRYEWRSWSSSTLQWARNEGCTSLTTQWMTNDL